SSLFVRMAFAKINGIAVELTLQNHSRRACTLKGLQGRSDRKFRPVPEVLVAEERGRGSCSFRNIQRDLELIPTRLEIREAQLPFDAGTICRQLSDYFACPVIAIDAEASGLPHQRLLIVAAFPGSSRRRRRDLRPQEEALLGIADTRDPDCRVNL